MQGIFMSVLLYHTKFFSSSSFPLRGCTKLMSRFEFIVNKTFKHMTDTSRLNLLLTTRHSSRKNDKQMNY